MTNRENEWQEIATIYSKAIERVRELHKPTKNYGYEFERCEACWDMRTDSAVNYPCQTIKALDGEQ